MIAAPTFPSEAFRATDRGPSTPDTSNAVTEPLNPAAPGPGLVGSALGWLIGDKIKDLTVWIAAMAIGLALVFLGLYLLTRDLLPSPAAAVAAAVK